MDLLLRMKVNSKRTCSNLLCLLGSRSRISALLRILRYTSKLRHFSRVSRVSSTGKSVLPTKPLGKPVEEEEENALWLIIITVLHFLCVSVLDC